MNINRSKLRQFTQGGFFLLFLLAPILDIFRLDLNQGHFIIFSHAWTLGFEESSSVAMNVLTRVFIPVFLLLSLIVWVIWKWGRLYCGWLCPHFSVVEMINQVMLKYLNRVTLWENPVWEKPIAPVISKINWLIVIFTAVLMAFIWAISLLSYLLPPKEIYSELLSFNLSAEKTRFLIVATIIFSTDFIFARHLFCRFGCAVGIFQSIIWMGNSKALRISVNKSIASQCKTCDNECDKACPMRLKPRGQKRAKFNCTQCGVCLNTCDKISNSNNFPDSVIKWKKEI